MPTLAENIAAYNAAYATMKPYEDAIQAELWAAVKEIKAVARESKLYGSRDWAFGWVSDIGHLSFRPGDIEAEGFVFDEEDDNGNFYRLTFETLANPRAAAEQAAREAIARREVEATAWREARRARLAAELAELG